MRRTGVPTGRTPAREVEKRQQRHAFTRLRVVHASQKMRARPERRSRRLRRAILQRGSPSDTCGASGRAQVTGVRTRENGSQDQTHQPPDSCEVSTSTLPLGRIRRATDEVARCLCLSFPASWTSDCRREIAGGRPASKGWGQDAPTLTACPGPPAR